MRLYPASTKRKNSQNAGVEKINGSSGLYLNKNERTDLNILFRSPPIEERTTGSDLTGIISAILISAFRIRLVSITSEGKRF